MPSARRQVCPTPRLGAARPRAMVPSGRAPPVAAGSSLVPAAAALAAHPVSAYDPRQVSGRSGWMPEAPTWRARFGPTRHWERRSMELPIATAAASADHGVPSSGWAARCPCDRAGPCRAWCRSAAMSGLWARLVWLVAGGAPSRTCSARCHLLLRARRRESGRSSSRRQRSRPTGMPGWLRVGCRRERPIRRAHLPRRCAPPAVAAWGPDRRGGASVPGARPASTTAPS